jgi:hypothetical protein
LYDIFLKMNAHKFFEHDSYAAEWGGLVWVFTPGNQTGAGLVPVWVSPGPVWFGSGFAGSDPVD